MKSRDEGRYRLWSLVFEHNNEAQTFLNAPFVEILAFQKGSFIQRSAANNQQSITIPSVINVI